MLVNLLSALLWN